MRNGREENLQVTILGGVGNASTVIKQQLATGFLCSVQNTFVSFLFLCTEVNNLDSSSFGFHFKELVSAFTRFKSGVNIKADADCSLRPSRENPVVS